MGKVILIAGSETLLGRKMIEKNLAAGNSVIAPVESKSEDNNTPRKNNLLVVPWNKSSIISARTVIREGLRVFKEIDEAVLVYSDNKTNSQLNDLSTSEIDEAINSSINGTVYLTKELLKIFSASKSATLAFAVVNKLQTVNNPLEQGLSGFYKSFADSIIISDNKIYKCAFTTSISEMDSYASFICRILQEKPQKADRQWLNYSERKNLFSSLPIIPRKNESI